MSARQILGKLAKLFQYTQQITFCERRIKKNKINKATPHHKRRRRRSAAAAGEAEVCN